MKYFIIAAFTVFAIAGFTSCQENTTPSATEAPNSSTVSATADWKLGVQMWTFRMFTFTEALNKVDSAGIKNIEAYSLQPLGGGMKDSFGINMSAESRSKIKELLRSKGIQMVAMGVISPKNYEEWQKSFELAKEFGLSYVTAEPSDDQWQYVDSMAGAFNIKVAIHDHPRPSHYWSPDSVLAAMQGHPNIGSCADIGHWARSGLNPVECLKKLEGHVYGVHLKDIVTFNDVDAADTVVGKGIIDYPAVFSELNRQHFKGMFSIEHESNWFHSLPDVIATKDFYNDLVSKLK